jgi:hypothetical protein
LTVLALRKELDSKSLAKLANRFIGDDISDHAIGTLMGKMSTGDKVAKKAIMKLRQTNLTKHMQEIQRYIRLKIPKGCRRKHQTGICRAGQRKSP